MSAFEKGKIGLESPARASFDTLLHTVAIDVKNEEGKVVEKRVALPIDVDAVAQKLGLIVQRLSLPEDVDGMLLKDVAYEPFKAVLNIEDTLEESRFTLAHEIGHFVHQYQEFPESEIGGILEKRTRTLSDDPNEQWADNFAYELLMPSSALLNMWADDLSLEQIASKFGLSTEQVSSRALMLGLKHG